MLKEAGYDVLYLHQLDGAFSAEAGGTDVRSAFLNLVRQNIEDGRWSQVVFAVFYLVRELLKKGKIAVMADDVF